MGNDSRIRSTLNCERGMKPISGIVNSISELIGQLTLPAREKRELEIGLLKLIQELERELTQARAVAVQEEVKGNWLQRSGRLPVYRYWRILPGSGICWRSGWEATWWGEAGKKSCRHSHESHAN